MITKCNGCGKISPCTLGIVPKRPKSHGGHHIQDEKLRCQTAMFQENDLPCSSALSTCVTYHSLIGQSGLWIALSRQHFLTRQPILSERYFVKVCYPLMMRFLLPPRLESVHNRQSADMSRNRTLYSAFIVAPRSGVLHQIGSLMVVFFCLGQQPVVMLMLTAAAKKQTRSCEFARKKHTSVFVIICV